MKVKKRLLAVVLALAAMSGTTLATAGSASASAYGCTGYGSGITWEGFYVKNGTWCGGVVGSGTYIKYISGNFYTHIILNTVCNFRMRADFYAANGAWYGWAETGIQYRCKQRIRPAQYRTVPERTSRHGSH